MGAVPSMFQFAAHALLAFGVSLAMVPICRRIAIRFGVVARPRADRWHGTPTALLGGAAIALTVLALHATLVGVSALSVLLVGGAAMFLIGLMDDVWSLRPVTKLVFVIAVASFFVFFRYRLSWSPSLTLDTLLTLLWIVGLTNAFNLLDNMDGLCAGLCLVAGAGVMGTFATDGMLSGPQGTHLALLAGATAGFLVYNFHPASIFMGDSGSLFIGLNLAVLTLSSPGYSRASASLLSIMAAPALILLVPILDTTLVTVSRVLSGRSAAQGGRDHSSHRLVAIGLSERAAVLVLWSLSALGGLLALSLNYGDGLPGVAAALFVIAVVIFAVYLARVRVYEDDRGIARGGGITPFVVNFVYRRRLAEVILDLCLVAIAYYGAYRLRFDGGEFVQHFPAFLQSLPLVLGVQLLSLFAVGGYRGCWRYFGMMDGVTFAKGILLGTFVNVSLVAYVYTFEPYSLSVFIIHAAVLMLLLAGSRASFRLISEFAHRRNQRGQRVLIYGAGDIAASAVRDLLTRRSGGYRMLGFIADDPALERTQMQGYPVLGNYAVLVRMLDEGAVDLVVITQSLNGDRLEALRQLCERRRVSLERLQLALDELVAAP